MPQNQSSQQAQQAPPTDYEKYLNDIFSSATPQDPGGNTSGPATPTERPTEGGAWIGGNYVPYSTLKDIQFPSQEEDMRAMMQYLPKYSQGPYAQTSKQEQISQQQFANRANSPYMLFGANNKFATAHPHIAGAIDNALLGASLIGQAHQRSLEAGGGVEGVGGAISDVAQGLLGIGPARTAYRQGLEEQGFQRQLHEAQVGAAQTEQLKNIMQAHQAYESNDARIASMMARGMNAEQIRAEQQRQANLLNNATKLETTNMNDSEKGYVTQIQGLSKKYGPNSPQFMHEQQAFQAHLHDYLSKLKTQLDYAKNRPDTGNPFVDTQIEKNRSQAQAAYDAQYQDEMERAARIARQLGYSDPYQTERGQKEQTKPYPQTPPTRRVPVNPKSAKPSAKQPAQAQPTKTKPLTAQQLYDKYNQ